MDLDVSKYWEEYDITNFEDINVNIAAGDGSLMKKNFLKFCFYTISAESLILTSRSSNNNKNINNNNNTYTSINTNNNFTNNSNNLIKVENSDLDLIHYHHFLNDRIRTYMGIFEVKNAVVSINNYDVDYYLIDGSIMGDIVRPHPLENKLSNNIKNRIINEIVPKLKNKLNISLNNYNNTANINNSTNVDNTNNSNNNTANINNSTNVDNTNNSNNNTANNDNINTPINNIGIISKNFEELVNNIVSNKFNSDINNINDNDYYNNLIDNPNKNPLDFSEDNRGFHKFNNAMIFLESLEYLISIKSLLENNKKIVAISKTSTANDYFNYKIPDMSLFNINSKYEGYSKPIYRDISKIMKHDFIIENSFFRNLKFTIFYLRLENYKNILKVELPYKANEEEILEIIKVLKRDAVDGYPYLLKKTHNDVEIKRKDIESLSNIVGLVERTGRDFL
ncbi:MAG: DNA double-strand break repair nuclease NurA [Methanobacteriaceae archaeon]